MKRARAVERGRYHQPPVCGFVLLGGHFDVAEMAL
jgi:hypothetical protein